MGYFRKVNSCLLTKELIIFLLLISLLLVTHYELELRSNPNTSNSGKKKEKTTKTYYNERFGFKFKYPSELTYTSQGPNLEQRKLNKGKMISGTIPPSFDTIVFTDLEGTKIFRVEIFHKNDTRMSAKNYVKEGYLYLYGPCDLRWGFRAEEFSQIENPLPILAVKGGYDVRQINFDINCYYLKSRTGNLIVFSTPSQPSLEDFNRADAILRKVLSTLNWLTFNPKHDGLPKQFFQKMPFYFRGG